MPAATTTGQWFTASDGHAWFFDAGATALDFAYTGAMGDNPAWEQFHDADDLGAWLGARFAGVEAGERDLEDARALRAAIAGALEAAGSARPVDAADVDVINLFAATPDIPPALSGGKRQAGRTRARAGQALSSLAREAVTVFGAESLGRIRRCADPACGLTFFDESRSNNRRWCSMQRCGNRAKVRAHRSRTAG
jgi:predicted RNA-binding Zn ribbon-like protein